MKRHIFVILLSLIVSTTLSAQPKREFRGAWIQCVNGQFQGIGTKQMQQTLTYQLDELQKDGVNAIIFQVRPECDALYPSKYEPWSRFLTGTQGMAPSPYWDPLQWMIDQCHKRGMELHAWINPFRAKTKVTKQLASSHIAVQRPDLVFPYDGQYILDPAKQTNRTYICKVTADILRRYDVDGLHIDDYFYPYPAAGNVIPDQQEYNANSRGFHNIGDWRRDNVNLFIKELHDTIQAIKPWVKFGVSPFGIYHNQSSTTQSEMYSKIPGSNTRGLQNFDQLYADVLLWVDKGWIDYCVPQLYWEIGHKSADYETLIKWWSKNAANRPLFIGEDIERTAKYNQQAQKNTLHSQLPNIQGTVLWYAKAAVDNVGNYGTNLRNYYWKDTVLQPEMPFISKKAPSKVSKIKPEWTSDGYVLFWQEPKSKSWDETATRYIVYRFGAKDKIDTDDTSHIVAITRNPWYKLPYNDGKEKCIYVIAPLNRIDNIGAWAKKKVKL